MIFFPSKKRLETPKAKRGQHFVRSKEEKTKTKLYLEAKLAIGTSRPLSKDRFCIDCKECKDGCHVIPTKAADSNVDEK